MTQTRAKQKGLPLPSERGVPTRAELIAGLHAKLRRMDSAALSQLSQHIEAGPVDGRVHGGRTGTAMSPKVLVGSGLGAVVSAARGRAVLDALPHAEDSDWIASDLEASGAVAARLDIAPATLANWRQSGRVIAFKKGPRNYVYPVRQFTRLGPAQGLAEIARHFGTADIAWDWLVTPNAQTGGKAPIDRLTAGHTTEVVRAAEGALDYL